LFTSSPSSQPNRPTRLIAANNAAPEIYTAPEMPAMKGVNLNPGVTSAS
jgi:hypothetical protein